MAEPTKVDPTKFKIDPNKASKDDVAAALELLEKQRYTKARIQAGELKGSTSWADMPEEAKEKARQKDKFNRVEIKIYKEKAIQAGIKVTQEEVLEAMKA